MQPPAGNPFQYRLREGETVIGRDPKSDVSLDDTRVSRRHALVVCDGDRLSIVDLSSRNGTHLNGRRLGDRSEVLAPGDVLKIGDFTLVFERDGAAPFVDPEASDSMRAVLQKAPADLLSNAVAAAAASGELSAVALRSELDKKTRVLGLFYELSRTLGSVFSLEDVYDKVIGILMQVTPAARVVIFQVADRDEMRHVASRVRNAHGPERLDPAAQPLRVSKTVFDNVAKQRVSVLLKSSKPNEIALPDSLLLQQTHSVMAAPIVGRRGLLGVIYADLQDETQTFSSDDLDLLNAVAVQTGIALDTVSAHAALQREAMVREKYERFLPQQLVDDVLLNPEREITPGGTRVTVSVLFADLRGFTTLSEATSPEAVVELLNRFLTLMSEVIFRHGGTLDKYLGDGVMALFGAPYASERHALKAVRAAIDMQRAVAQLNRE
ncbi:MAG: FHA domain-containing protein, partial [Acidobacteriota bacterium]